LHTISWKSYLQNAYMISRLTLLYCYTRLPENTLAGEYRHVVFLWVWVSGCRKIMGWCDYYWRPTNSKIPWNLKYWLMCLWCIFSWLKTTITFCAVREVHSLTLPGRLSTEPVSRVLAASELVMGWVHPWVGLGQSFFNFWWVGLGWVETWLRDIFNVIKYSTVCEWVLQLNNNFHWQLACRM